MVTSSQTRRKKKQSTTCRCSFHVMPKARLRKLAGDRYCCEGEYADPSISTLARELFYGDLSVDLMNGDGRQHY